MKGKENGLFPHRKKVSNPWREAIEAYVYIAKTVEEEFPILGGRLLKQTPIGCLRPFGKSFQSLEGGY